MDFSVRPTCLEDAASIARVHVESWRTTYAGIVPDDYLASLNVDARIAKWQDQLSDQKTVILVAEDASGVFGFASGGPAREGLQEYDSELYAIYLLQPHQKRGAGKGLMLELARELKAKGFHSMALWVLKDNPTVGFYKHIGGTQIAKKTIEIGGRTLIEIALGWTKIDDLLSILITKTT